MKSRFLACTILFVFLTTAYAQASTTAWEVTLYWLPDHSIVTLTADGITNRIRVPDVLSQIVDPQLAISSDKRWLAFADDPEAIVRPLMIADLASHTCCVSLGPKLTMPDGTKVEISDIIGFNPDNTRLAVDYYVEDTSGCDCPVTPQLGVAVIDPKTSDVTFNPPKPTVTVKIPAGWTSQGIGWTNGRFCMEGNICTNPLVMESETIEDVKTGEILSSMPIIILSTRVVADDGDHLRLTGEYVAPYFSHPSGSDVSDLNAPVVVYYSPQMDKQQWQEAPALIFTTEAWMPSPPDEEYLSWAKWVSDGNAVLIRLRDTADQAILLQRDGSQQTIAIPQYRNFLAGTPDGWLMIDGTSSKNDLTNIYFYQNMAGSIEPSQIATLPEFALKPPVLQSPALGASVKEPFATVPPPEFKGIG